MPAALLIGVTTDISTDVAAVPFLWIVPLTVYLATLILAFLRAMPIGERIGAAALPILAILVALRASHLIVIGIWPSIGLLLAMLAVGGPRAPWSTGADAARGVHLTRYSLLVAFGGAVGGIATGLLAPLAFRVPIEGLLAVALGIVLGADRSWKRARGGPVAGGRGTRDRGHRDGQPGHDPG